MDPCRVRSWDILLRMLGLGFKRLGFRVQGFIVGLLHMQTLRIRKPCAGCQTRPRTRPRNSGRTSQKANGTPEPDIPELWVSSSGSFSGAAGTWLQGAEADFRFKPKGSSCGLGFRV